MAGEQVHCAAANFFVRATIGGRGLSIQRFYDITTILIYIDTYSFQVKNDTKSAELVVLEQQLSLALGLSLKYLQREHEDIYAQLYDTEAEVEALEIEQNRLQKFLAQKKERLDIVQETNALLMTRLDVEKMRVNTEVQWKTKLDEEAGLRTELEKTLLKLQQEVLAVKTEY